jgi:hypothetical protein
VNFYPCIPHLLSDVGVKSGIKRDDFRQWLTTFVGYSYTDPSSVTNKWDQSEMALGFSVGCHVQKWLTTCLRELRWFVTQYFKVQCCNVLWRLHLVWDALGLIGCHKVTSQLVTVTLGRVPPSLLDNGYGVFSMGVNGPGREADRLPPFSDEATNACSDTSPPLAYWWRGSYRFKS